MNAPQHLCHRQQTPGGRPGAVEGLGARAREGPKMGDAKKTQKVKNSHNYVYVYFFHWCLIRKVCNHQTYGRLLKKILKTESKTWGNGILDLSHAKNEQLESWFWCTRHQSHEKTHQVFRSKRTQKSLKRTEKSPNELKFQIYVCDFQICSVYGQNEVTVPRLMGYVVKHARCSGLTATSI